MQVMMTASSFVTTHRNRLLSPHHPLHQRMQAVLIGESSHGTQEHYETRARISKRLIEESGFRGVCLEADFPEASSLHRFVMGSSTHAVRRRAVRTLWVA